MKLVQYSVMTDQSQQIYTSIDLELTGFDPGLDEILEVGFTKFTLGAGGPKVISSWQSVFQPSKTVRHKILGLTGIMESELESAPKFSEHREFIAREIKDTILVGHGLALDIRFLEAGGIPLPNQFIDTLDLAQWILPTYHSYNLESLMHLFSIKHLEAHRALSDSQAVIELLTRMLAIHQGFSAELKTQIQDLISQQMFSWQSLLSESLEPAAYPEVQVEQPEITSEQLAELQENSIIHLPLGTGVSDASLATNLAGRKATLALPDKHAVLQLWKQGLVAPIFASSDLFNEQKFSALCNGDLSNPELVKFLLKVSVWKAVNWQHRTVLDLNLSFFGGQFKSLISDDVEMQTPSQPVLAIDHRTLLKDYAEETSDGGFLVIKDLLSFEEAAGMSFGSRLSWGGVISRLRSIYNPEIDAGNRDLRDEVMTALAATDLFFSLVVLELSRRFFGRTAVSFDELEMEHPISFTKLHNASGNFLDKLRLMAPHQPELNSTISSLDAFFTKNSSEAKWIDFGQKHCVFRTEPLEFKSRIAKITKQYESVSVIESMSNQPLLDYLVERLGLESFTRANNQYQESKKVQVVASGSGFWSPDLLPAVMLFGDAEEVKSYYDDNYRNLKLMGQVYAEKYSGGGNKLLRNYGIRSNSVLLVSQPGLARMSHSNLRAKTLIIAGLPQPVDHPYQRALRIFWRDRFPEIEHIEAVKLLQRCFEHIDINSIERCLVASDEPEAIISMARGFEFLI